MVEHHVLGYAAPNSGNQPLAEAAYENIKAVGMPMATPIAHKGVVAGAKALALTLTVLDLMTTPQLLTDAKTYFTDVQRKTDHHDPIITASDQPAIHLNERVMAEMRPKMEKSYYDPRKHATYLDQLGIKYPTLVAQ